MSCLNWKAPKYIMALLLFQEGEDEAILSKDHEPFIAVIGCAYETNNHGIVVEKQVIVDDIHSFSEAICYLMAVLYSMNLQYPAGVTYTFELLQKYLLGVGDQRRSPKLNTLIRKIQYL